MKFQHWRSILVFLSVLIVVGVLGYAIEIAIPIRAPKLSNTYASVVHPTPQEIGAYDVLGETIDRATVAQLQPTEAGRVKLAPETGAIAITQDLIDLGRNAFYRETFGNEYFFTDVLGALNGPINLVSVGWAIAALGGNHTTNLQIPLDHDITVGGKEFKAGTLLNTGLDVPTGSLLPLGMQAYKRGRKIQVGLTCALCHFDRALPECPLFT